ncbi:hypothetical protein [Clostridium cellulovorans]|uniref:Uncharacterized protein n=1 Tax=Clostridium cellulovorans (strain ATCC 35296 / DSM 3052 / OCM 3 / 743B) TaxID=573061 RepID=D9STA4_CLOC7|nr:hypothetical protein [Clostridium cellulovorans]ADL50720.1 hypothetical protein Clocel_0954 [Clostridium cellulovorans 743B]
MSKVISVFKKAPFPAVVTVISFLFFIFIYSGEFVSAITPHYVRKLMYSIPFITFGFITFLATKRKLSCFASCTITGVLIHICPELLLVLAIFFAFADGDDLATKDINKYGKALRLTNHSLTKYFPKKIPENARNITFSYSPEFM